VVLMSAVAEKHLGEHRIPGLVVENLRGGMPELVLGETLEAGLLETPSPPAMERSRVHGALAARAGVKQVLVRLTVRQMDIQRLVERLVANGAGY